MVIDIKIIVARNMACVHVALSTSTDRGEMPYSPLELNRAGLFSRVLFKLATIKARQLRVSVVDFISGNGERLLVNS